MPKKFCGPEVICCVTGAPNGDLHHVLHKAPRGQGSDHPKNLMPLSHALHQEVHQIGLVRFAQKHSAVWRWLLQNDWHYDPILLTWFPPPEAREPLKKSFIRTIGQAKRGKVSCTEALEVFKMQNLINILTAIAISLALSFAMHVAMKITWYEAMALLALLDAAASRVTTGYFRVKR